MSRFARPSVSRKTSSGIDTATFIPAVLPATVVAVNHIWKPRRRGKQGGHQPGPCREISLVSLAWMLSKPFITAPIVGTTAVKHVEAAAPAKVRWCHDRSHWRVERGWPHPSNPLRDSATGYLGFPDNLDVTDCRPQDSPAGGALSPLRLGNLYACQPGETGCLQQSFAHVGLHRLLSEIVFAVKVDVLGQTGATVRIAPARLCHP